MSAEWINWRGGACPIDGRAEVEVRFTCGHTSAHSHRAGKLRWTHAGEPFDIAAYRVTSVEEVQ